MMQQTDLRRNTAVRKGYSEVNESLVDLEAIRIAIDALISHPFGVPDPM